MTVADGETLLPARGRPGNPPAWPLSRASKRERELWRRAWRRPQALVWEQLGVEELVAFYVRTLARAEAPDSAIGLGTQVRQLADSLGLTPAGLRMHRWRILGRTVEEKSAPPSQPPIPMGPRPDREHVPVYDQLKVLPWRDVHDVHDGDNEPS